MPSWIEIVGYAASAAIVVSLAMTSVVRLRIISLVGCVLFVVYGVLVNAWPVVISNAMIALINIWFLYQEFTTRKDVGAVPIAPDAPYLRDFIAANRADIRRFHPAFEDVDPGSRVWLLTRDGLPAGVLAGRAEGSTFHITLDHVTPAYRDSRLGDWLFSGDGREVLREAGFDRVVTTGDTPGHRKYLVGLRFDGERDTFSKRL